MGSSLQRSLARVVFTSSPVRRRGSTLKVPPSISPTPKSTFGPEDGSGFWEPPVIFSVFSGTESLGTKSFLTLVRSSGGAASWPMLGISFEMVEFVLVMCGLRGFSFMYRRYSSAVSLPRSLRGIPAKRVLLLVNVRTLERAANWLDRRMRRAGVMFAND